MGSMGSQSPWGCKQLDITERLSLHLVMRRCKDWNPEISSWKWLVIWRSVPPVSLEHRAPHSPPWTPFRVCWRSTAAAGLDSISSETDGKCPWQAPICSWHHFETGGKGIGHNIYKNDIATGHDKNWLEPTRSKMVEDSTPSRTWASLYLHCNTSAKWNTHQCPDGSETLHQSVQFSCSIMSDSLQPHGLQHARPPCPSPTPGVYSNSCPSSQWCHPTISSSVVLFFHLQSFWTSGSFQMSQLFNSGGQITGVSASTSVLPINIQDWFSLGWTGWISLQCKGLFSSSLLSAIRVMSSAYLRLLIFLLAILIPAYASSSPAFHIMYST